MKSEKSSRGPGSKSFPERKALRHQSIVFDHGRDRRDGDARSRRATGAVTQVRPSSKVLFGCRVGAGGGSRQKNKQKPYRHARTKGYVAPLDPMQDRPQGAPACIFGEKPTWPGAEMNVKVHGLVSYGGREARRVAPVQNSNLLHLRWVPADLPCATHACHPLGRAKRCSLSRQGGLPNFRRHPPNENPAEWKGWRQLL